MKKITLLTLLTLSLATTSFARDLRYVGSIDSQVPLKPAPCKKLYCASSSYQLEIKIPKIKLTHSSEKRISKKVSESEIDFSPSPIQRAVNPNNQRLRLPSNVNLGMNGVPVLNQGYHGTCATFANTSAINAAMNWGDGISQHCHLSLGQHLAENGYLETGWDGNFGPSVLHQLLSFGIVKKSKEKSANCGHLQAYPTYTDEIGDPMPLSEFSKVSEDISEKITWRPLLGTMNLNAEQFGYEMDDIVTAMKISLTQGHRVTIGYLLLAHHGHTGATGDYHGNNTTYVLSQDIKSAMQLPLTQEVKDQLGGHEVLVFGYDNDAVAVDRFGQRHKGLFKFRNSWTAAAGEHGDYYMSYDYARALLLEAQEIVRIDRTSW